ncbi:MAG: ribonuclease III [Defluviitaleaceae bacterium]|nr:ribonuclease III [Defluviitaleaceae bacterium]
MNKEIEALSPGALAYIGDAVFEVMVRERIVKTYSIHQLHKKAMPYVSAKGQSQMYNKLLEIATEEEAAILKRGRNFNAKAPKSATVLEYRHATGVEALFGYLYLKGKNDRLYHIFEIVYTDKESDKEKEQI